MTSLHIKTDYLHSATYNFIVIPCENFFFERTHLFENMIDIRFLVCQLNFMHRYGKLKIKVLFYPVVALLALFWSETISFDCLFV